MAYVTEHFEQQINVNVIKSYLPQLIKTHQDLIQTYLIGVIQMIASAYNFYSNTEFMIKLQLNNYKDIKWLLTLSIPYVDNTSKQLETLKSLNH